MMVDIKLSAKTKKFNTAAPLSDSGCQTWSCTSNCGSGTGHKCEKQVKTQISSDIKKVYNN